jgi:hypothetical protein
MQLVLLILFSFAVLGLTSRRFDARQQVVIAVSAVALAVAQFTFARFL